MRGIDAGTDIARLKPRVEKFFVFYHKRKEATKTKPSKFDVKSLAKMIHLERIKAYQQGLKDAGKPDNRNWFKRLLNK